MKCKLNIKVMRNNCPDPPQIKINDFEIKKVYVVTSQITMALSLTLKTESAERLAPFVCATTVLMVCPSKNFIL